MLPAPEPIVFVVDDDDLVRASIQGMLKSVGLRSQTFGTAQEFLRSQRPEGPSCLVLDVRLPGVNGLDFQHQLIGAGIRIPVIFITGHGDILMTVKPRTSWRGPLSLWNVTGHPANSRANSKSCENATTY